MPYNPYNPYPPYPPQANYQAAPQNTYAFVNGVEGAKSYYVQPNQTVMLMDSDDPIAYMKSANAMGQATIKYFRLVETSEQELRGQPKQAPSYVLKADFDALAKRVDELLKKGSDNA